MVDVDDRVAAPLPVPVARMREGWQPLTGRYTLGVVRGRPWRFTLGPLTLLEFGDPEETSDGVRWPVNGGLLSARPGGVFEIGWRDRQLRGHLWGWAPRLPMPIYRVSQLLVHHAVTRQVLLQLRGREPLPGEPAEMRRRALAAVVDLALCVAVARRSPRRRLAALAGVACGYHLAAWAAGGYTLGGALFGQRVVSVDGSRVTLAQAVVRLLAGDGVAGTAVVRE